MLLPELGYAGVLDDGASNHGTQRLASLGSINTEFQKDSRVRDGKGFLKLHVINLGFHWIVGRLEHAVAEQPDLSPNSLRLVKNHLSIQAANIAVASVKHP